MKKKPTLEEKQALLTALRANPDPVEVRETLRGLLEDRAGNIVTRAAKLAGELELAVLAPALEAAFDRMCIDAVKTDPGCRAKMAIVQALHKLEHIDPEVFLKAVGYVQLEPVWGGSEDTAATLRGYGAFGLVQARYHAVGAHLVELLADPEKAARMAAARAMADWGRPEAGLLLRLKLLQGDPEPEVMGECFEALMTVSGAEAVPFVARFLTGPRPGMGRGRGSRLVDPEVVLDNATAETAAMALGQSRCAEALEPLRQAWERNSHGPSERVFLVSIALLRLPAGTDFLVGLIDEGGRSAAVSAIAALGPYLYEPALRERVARAVEQRGLPVLQTALREALERAARE